MSPQSKEQIKRAESNRPGTYISPHHGDGGWHGSSFESEKFDNEWQPMNDRILLRLIPIKRKYESIVRPENAAQETTTRHAIVVRVGPGKRIEGINGGTVRRPVEVRPGDEVIIGQYTDWEGFNGEFVLAQEADVRLIVNSKAASA